MRHSSSIRRRRDRTHRFEEGYLLIIFLVVLALMMIALTAAAPRLAQQIQRDREIEMIHRGEAYARAIKRYYKKFNRYPGRIEDLENTNTIKFIRKRYKDPITGGPWRLVRYGEIQLTSPAGGIGTPAGGGGTPGQPGQANNPQSGSQSGLFNLNFGGTSGQQNAATAAAGANAAATPGSTPTSGASAGTGTPAPTDTVDATSGTTGTTGSTGQNTTTSTFGQTGAGAPAQTTSSSSSLFSSPAGTAQPGGGGGAIIGVASLSKKNGIHEFNKKSAYKDWLFVYDPGQDSGQLLHGPYNPQAFVGQIGSPAGSPIGSPIASPGGTTGTPGATGTPSPFSSFPTTGMPSPTTGQPSGNIVPSTQ